MDYAWIDLGTIVTVHGLLGEVVVKTTGDGPEGITRHVTLHLFPPGGDATELELESSRIHRGMALLKFRGINDRDQAFELVGGSLKIRREELPPLPEGRFYIADLIGLMVETTDGRPVGRVRDVLETGANDVYVLDFQGREVLIPAVDTIVKSVDVEGGKITIEMMEGLLD